MLVVMSQHQLLPHHCKWSAHAITLNEHLVVSKDCPAFGAWLADSFVFFCLFFLLIVRLALDYSALLIEGKGGMIQ